MNTDSLRAVAWDDETLYMYIGIEHWKAKQNVLLVQSHPFHYRTFMLTHLQTYTVMYIVVMMTM